MSKIAFREGMLTEHEQRTVAAGFARDAESSAAPQYARQSVNWVIRSDDNALVGVLTADVLWDWLYVDELWTDESVRGFGYGRQLLEAAEAHADTHGLSGIWLWTQSWQAAPFYERLGYEEFARFPDFPRGHARVGFRKVFYESPL